MSRARRFLFVALLPLAWACMPAERPRLPPLLPLSLPPGSDGSLPAPADGEVAQLLVLPRRTESGHIPGIGAEQQGLCLFDLVAVLTRDGRLEFSDLPPANAKAVQRYEKLDDAHLEMSSAQGRCQGGAFYPAANVLAALDSGYVIEVRFAGRSRRIVFRPLYDAALYAPFVRQGREGPAGATGVPGSYGETGRAGRDGQDGKDGERGTPGQDGLDGEAGKAGEAGRRGGDGGPGGPGGRGGAGDPGPLLRVEARPIYSKFYPDEELVFVQVTAEYRDRGGGSLGVEAKNYIFHPRQAFLIRTIGGQGGEGGSGGDGGPGGDGGRGGHGGQGGDGGSAGTGGGAANGGKGGDGGRGGNGGAGGHGGDGGSGGLGGPGGDGGDVEVRLLGSDDFMRGVRESLQVDSHAGAGGAGGRGGEGGRGGSGGRGGDGGRGGSGGFSAGGGRSGEAGRDGERGRDGKAGEPGHDGRDGSPGPSGHPGEVRWRAGGRGG